MKNTSGDKAVMSCKSNCENCLHHARRQKLIYCVLNHYFPRKEIIDFQGCNDYIKETIDLLNWNEERG